MSQTNVNQELPVASQQNSQQQQQVTMVSPENLDQHSVPTQSEHGYQPEQQFPMLSQQTTLLTETNQQHHREFVQTLQQATQPSQHVAQTTQQFMQPPQQVVKPLQQSTQPTQPPQQVPQPSQQATQLAQQAVQPSPGVVVLPPQRVQKQQKRHVSEQPQQLQEIDPPVGQVFRPIDDHVATPELEASQTTSSNLHRDPLASELPVTERNIEQEAINELFGGPRKSHSKTELKTSSIQELPQIIDHSQLPPQQAVVQPLQQVVQPMQQSGQPSQQVVQPPQQVIQPVQHSVQPVQQPVQPIQQVVQPAQQHVQPTQQVIQPTHVVRQEQQPVQPTQQVIQPAQQVIQPTQQVIQQTHVVQPAQQVIQPTHVVQPAQQPVQPTQQVIQPIQQVIQPTHVIQPAQQVMQPTHVVQPAQQVIQPTHVVQPAQQPVQPAQVIQPIQQVIQPTHVIQPAQQVMQPTHVVQPAKQVIQPTHVVQPAQQPVSLSQHTVQPAQHVVQPSQPAAQAEPVVSIPQSAVQTPGNTFQQSPANPYQDPTPMMAAQQMLGVYGQQATLSPEQVQQYTQYYQQLGYTAEQITQILAQQYGHYSADSMTQGGYGDMYSSMWMQQQQYMQQMQAAYYYGYYTHPAYSSYPSSAASSQYGGDDSRPGSVIERRSSITSDQVLSELGDLTSELSFQHRTVSPPIEEVIHRTTPLSFTRPHIAATFSITGGILNIVAPKQPLDGEVATVQNILVENIVDIPMLKRFPGPLLRGDTNKKQITNFIIETIRVYLPHMYGHDNNQLLAHIALWEFVGLLVKQNGTFDGSDVADMLCGLLPTVEVKNGKDTKNFSSLCHDVVAQEAHAQEDFYSLMISGRSKDGLDHAIQHNMWGQAFMLSSMSGPKLLSMVQAKFMSSLKNTDPMRTLYTHLSKKDSDSILIKKRVQADTWIQNLCMLVSHPTANPDKDRLKITMFGDALRDLGLVAAAHLCYLIANVDFGCHVNADSRLALLGLEHKEYTDKAANVWVDSLNVQLTEIYQYARTLHNKSFAIPKFQQYKYEYALNLIDYGYSPQSLAYLESISEAIFADTTYKLFSRELCTNMTGHATRMIVQENEKYDEIEFPDWINKLELYGCRAQYYISSMIPDVDLLTVVSSTNTSHDLHRSASSDLPFSPMPQDSTSTDTTRSRDSSKDTNAAYDTVDPANQNTPYFVPTNIMQENQNNQNSYGWQPHENEGQLKESEHDECVYDRLDHASPKYENSLHPVDDGMVNHSDNSSYVAESPRYDPNQYEVPQEVYQENETYQENIPEDNDHHEPQQEETQANVFTPYNPNNPNNEPTQNDEQNYSSPPMFYNTTQNDSFNNTFNAPYTNERLNTPSNQPQRQDDGIEEEEDLFGGFSKTKSMDSNKTGNNKTASQSKPKKEQTPKKADGGQKKGWFGWLKFGNKDMHLPDDKDKSIVYDKDTGKWVDKNADPADDPAPPPPPPTGSFGTPTAMPPTGPINTPSMNFTPSPSVGFVTPNQFSQPKRTSSTLSAHSNYSTGSSNAVESIHEPTNSTAQQAPSGNNQHNILAEPPVQSMSHRGRESIKKRKSTLRKPQNDDEDKKPSGPPSVFSLKAQGGRRGASRYAALPGSSTSKNSPMTPVLDPFASPMATSGGSTPMNLFTPGTVQKNVTDNTNKSDTSR